MIANIMAQASSQESGDTQSKWWLELDSIGNCNALGEPCKWRCHHCEKEKTGGASMLRAHLLGEKKVGKSICYFVHELEKA